MKLCGSDSIYLDSSHRLNSNIMIKMYIETVNIGILIISEVFHHDLKFKILYTLKFFSLTKFRL